MYYQARVCFGTQNSLVNRIVFFHVIGSQGYMLHLLKKPKLYIKLEPESVHKAPVSIQIKMYYQIIKIYYQHLKKYFYNCNITLNYYTT